MKKIFLSSILAVSILSASDYKFEVTPMIGGNLSEGNLSLEDHFSNAGLAIGFNIDNKYFNQIEIGFLTSLEDVKYNNSNLNTNITRYFTNIVKDYKINEKASLYALAGIGYETFSKESFNNEDSMFGNYGFGLKYKLSDNFALKTDLRHIVETDHGDNSLLYNLGFAMSFGKKTSSTPIIKEEKITLIQQKTTIPRVKDSDNDGIYDSIDKCPNSPADIVVNSDGCTKLIDLNINFDTDSSIIKNEYNERLIKFANLLNKDTTLSATIHAHTDSDGSTKYNQVLSEKRASSTIKALTNLNVEASRLIAKGYGESKPVASNKTAEGKAKNRRVNATLHRD